MATFWFVSVASNKGEAEPERKETRTKVDEDRKHEYPFLICTDNIQIFVICHFTFCFVVFILLLPSTGQSSVLLSGALQTV